MAAHLCSTWAHHHLGPLIIIAVGIGFAIVGAIPVAINFTIGSNNSSTIIGVGFIGFGLLLMIPGLCWCVIQRFIGLKRVCDCGGRCCCCSSGDRSRWGDAEAEQDSQEMTTALESRHSKNSSAGTDEVCLSSVHNDCIFTVEEYDDDDDDDEEDEAKSDGVIIIPIIHKTSPSR